MGRLQGAAGALARRLGRRRRARAAGRQLHRQPPLAALEEALGTQLLIRSAREFSWTADGRAAVDAAQAMEEAVAGTVRAVRGTRQEVAGTVPVGVVPALVPDLVAEVLPPLRAAHPDLGVEFIGSYCRADLARGEADVAVRMARPEEGDLIAQRAFDLGWFVYAQPGYLERAGRPRTHDELRQHRRVLYLPHMHAVAPMRWLEQHRQEGHEVARVDSVDLACIVAASGSGLAVLPTFVGDRNAQLVRVFAERVSVNTGWIVFHESARNSARVRAVADALPSHLRAAEPVLAGLAPPEAA